MSKLRPVIIINVMNGKGETIDSARLPYNGDQMALTDKISELLEKHQGINDVVVLPTTGYELNQ